MSANDKIYTPPRDTGLGKVNDGYVDVSGTYPTRQYSGKQTTNLEARGIEENTIPYGGGDVNVNSELVDFPPSEYPYNQVRKSAAGHVTEFDDTPGRERILIKHKRGTGVEFQPDGTILLYSTKNTVRVSAGDDKVIIEGDGDITYHGNVRMRVDGDFDLEVGGNFNVTAHGDHVEDIKGGYRQDIAKNMQSLIGGNVTQHVAKNRTEMIYGQDYKSVKGNVDVITEGNAEINSKGHTMLTSQDETAISAPSINIGTKSLLVASDTGTIGGENVVYYGHTAHIPRINSTSMHATTFHGTLEGNAATATQAGRSGTAGALGASGSAGTHTVETATNKTTAQPTNTIMTSYLDDGEFAVRQVTIDPGNVLYNQINRSADYGGVSDRTLSPTEVRSKLRDPKNQSNETFIGEVIGEGSLHGSYSNTTPDDIDRIVAEEATPRRNSPKGVIGNKIGSEAKRFKGSVLSGRLDISIAAKYKPENNGQINSRTELAPGITIAKFLGGYGDSITFDHVTTNASRVEIARNLLLHAGCLKEIMLDTDEFDEYRLIVAEGIYKKGPSEVVTTGGLNDLKTKGRCVVYELRNRNGKIDNKKTFDLAMWWKDSLQYENMILSYDTYDPSGEMIAQIVMVMPELTSSYEATFNNSIQTMFNNTVQSTNELIECIQE